jgi:hypothetical protein
MNAPQPSAATRKMKKTRAFERFITFVSCSAQAHFERRMHVLWFCLSSTRSSTIRFCSSPRWTVMIAEGRRSPRPNMYFWNVHLPRRTRWQTVWNKTKIGYYYLLMRVARKWWLLKILEFLTFFSTFTYIMDGTGIVELDHEFQDSELINAVAINNPFIGLWWCSRS